MQSMNPSLHQSLKASRRRSWCEPSDPCRYCKDYLTGGTLRQACVKRPESLKKTRRPNKKNSSLSSTPSTEPRLMGLFLLTEEASKRRKILEVTPQPETKPFRLSQSKAASNIRELEELAATTTLMLLGNPVDTIGQSHYEAIVKQMVSLKRKRSAN